MLAQVQITAKSNEIPAFTPLLRLVAAVLGSLKDVLVVADALHAQTGHADLLAADDAHLMVAAKANQCATRRSDTSPLQAGQTRREVCWVRWLTWIRKVKGTRACQETGGRVQMPETACRETRAVWRRLDCLNPTSSGSNLLRPERHPKPVSVVSGVYWFTLDNLRGGSDTQRGHSRR
ncbi:hypothetical protein QTQ03_24255 [Micromonospora sp. WMMA1363]|nr:transposase [Micromonospora sp. WMMA1363]MDM4722550.1 hypothetical protein [Micromonospora sp. WMMA1363]